MCSGRVDLAFLFRAFSRGADGVFIGACHLNECNYSTHGNYHALGMVNICRKILKYVGLNPERLRIAFMSGAEANLFVEVTNDFVKKVQKLGPLGKSEGIDDRQLKFRLEAVAKLIPYIRLVERERLRVPMESEERCTEFFESDEVNNIIHETIMDKLAISQMTSLLGEGPLTTAEIAQGLGLTPSEVSKYLNNSTRHRLVRYDEGLKRYALA